MTRVRRRLGATHRPDPNDLAALSWPELVALADAGEVTWAAVRDAVHTQSIEIHGRDPYADVMRRPARSDA
jgi:hypothetical protein